MIRRFHQTLVFTFLLVLQESLAYVQPIHIRYSDEQLKALEENQRPIQFDQPRTLIDNPYGAQIYYEDILPEDEEILAARNSELQNESFRRGQYENEENIPNQFNSPDVIQKFWNHRNNMHPYTYSLHMQTVSPNGINNNYYLNYYAQQYSEYLRELLYEFYFQKQVLLELINHQEQQLKLLRAQFDQLNGAISNTEHQLYQIHSPPSPPSSIPPNQQNPSSTPLSTSTSTSPSPTNQQYPYQPGQAGSEIKPSEIEKETEQTPTTEESNTNIEDNIDNNNNVQINNNNNMMMNSFSSSSNEEQEQDKFENLNLNNNKVIIDSQK